MKILSLNLEGFKDWKERQPNILAYIKKEQPDLIVFQEAVYLPTISPFNQVQLLNQTLQYPYIHSSISRLQKGVEIEVYREGLAVMSYHPIVSTDVIILQREEGDPHNRLIQLIDVFYENHVVKLANIQFSLTDDVDYATAHLKETLAILQSRDEARIIIGDFNMNHLEEFEHLWGEEYDASTCVPYISYPSMNKRNDYALLPKDHYEFDRISVSGDGLSDHRGLLIEFSQRKT